MSAVLSQITTRSKLNLLHIVPSLAVTIGLMALVGIAISENLTKTSTWFAPVVGMLVIMILYFAYITATGKSRFSDIYCGKDGRPSTSKFQALVWTIVVIFTYVSMFVLRVVFKVTDADSLTVPPYLMIAMGLTLTTTAAAKGITVAYVNAGQVTKPAPDPDEPANVVVNDLGSPDFSKIQMLWWTFVAVGVYAVTLYPIFADHKGTNLNKFPDIDPTLMVLMGLSQGLYVGKKLVTTDTPVTTTLSALSGPPGTKISINGVGFGIPQGTSIVTIDGVPLQQFSWTETQIVIEAPATHPSRGAWSTGQRFMIDVVVGGRSSGTPLWFTVVLPAIQSLSASSAKPSIQVTINGEGFGSDQLPVRHVRFGTAAATVVSWSERQIVAMVPPTGAGGAAWNVGASAPITVEVGSHTSLPAPFTIA